MPDMDYADQIVALSRALSKLATGHPGRPSVGLAAPVIPHAAKDLYERGYRFHPELASKLDSDPEPKGSGADARQMKGAHAALMAWLKQHNPSMHDRVVAAQSDPMQAALLVAEIHREHPEVIAKGAELMTQMAANP